MSGISLGSILASRVIRATGALLYSFSLAMREIRLPRGPELTAQSSGATPNPTVNRRHQITALLYLSRSVPSGIA